jgi:hypothetical protein
MLRPISPAASVHLPGRSLADLISAKAKPFGALAILDPDRERQLLATRPVADITDIAGRRAERTEIGGPWPPRERLCPKEHPAHLPRRLGELGHWNHLMPPRSGAAFGSALFASRPP